MLYLVIAPVSRISQELSHYISLIQVTARYRPDIFGCVVRLNIYNQITDFLQV